MAALRAGRSVAAAVAVVAAAAAQTKGKRRNLSDGLRDAELDCERAGRFDCGRNPVSCAVAVAAVALDRRSGERR